MQIPGPYSRPTESAESRENLFLIVQNSHFEQAFQGDFCCTAMLVIHYYKFLKKKKVQYSPNLAPSRNKKSKARKG
jgi:hypothetical protein